MDAFENKVNQLRNTKPETTTDLSVLSDTPETLPTPELWREKATLIEYDPAELLLVYFNQEMRKPDSPYIELQKDIVASLIEVKENKNGYLKNTQRSYFYAGSEHGHEKVLIGKIVHRMCLVGDEEEEIIISPLFDSLLVATPQYMDIQIGDHRLRLLRGNYETSEARPDSRRIEDYELADSIPDFVDLDASIRVAVLERVPARIVTSESLEADPEVIVHPSHAAHTLFQGVQNAITSHYTSQQPNHQLVEQLRQVEKALQLPAVQLGAQFYQLTLRTSPSADVLYLHNTSYKSDRDRVADAMQHMSIPDFLELATDDERRQELLHETLADLGFYFIRHHTGEIFLMGRGGDTSSVISPNDPFFSNALAKAEGKLVEYFARLAEDSAIRTPFRSTRVQLADEIEQRIPTRATLKRNMARTILDWLNGN